MSKLIEISEEEFNNLNNRLKKLGTEKSYLQLINDMMKQLSTVSGLENTIDKMLSIVMDNIGGSNITVYYLIDGEYFFADVFGNRGKYELDKDVNVKKVFESAEPIVVYDNFILTQMTIPDNSRAITWIFPLKVTNDLIGVLGLENILISAKEIENYLEVFFNYCALVLKNEILGYTKLKKAYDQLRESEFWLKESQKVGKIGSYIFDLQTSTWSSSDALNEIYGIPKDYEKTIEGWSSIIHPEFRESTVNYFLEKLNEKSFFDKEYKIINFKTKEERWVQGYGRFELDEKGVPVKMIGTIQDITTKKLYEQNLIQSEKKYRLLTDHVSDVIWIYNLTLQKFTYISPSIFYLRGYTVEEAIAQSLGESLTPESKKLVEEGINITIPQFIESKEKISPSRISEIQQPCKNGEIIWVETSTQFRYNEENQIEILGVSRNINERKKIENELKIREFELREANKTKDKLFSIIAHDLRSPFTIFLNLSNILATELDTLSKDQIVSFSKRLNESLTKQYELLSDLLDWARIQTGSFKINIISFNLFNEVNKVIGPLAITSSAKNIEVKNLVDEKIVMKADVNMIKLVIRNLINNSIKFTPNGGMIQIEASELEDNYQVVITDNGVGMSRDTMNQIFKENSLYTTEGTSKEKGTGLGLLLCKDILEKHNGKIWVESEPNVGSKFIFQIPRL